MLLTLRGSVDEAGSRKQEAGGRKKEERRMESGEWRMELKAESGKKRVWLKVYS